MGDRQFRQRSIRIRPYLSSNRTDARPSTVQPGQRNPTPVTPPPDTDRTERSLVEEAVADDAPEGLDAVFPTDLLAFVVGPA